MANQLKMAEVQAILALTRSGWSDRHIARQLGVHRETVGRHRRLSSQDSSKPASAPTGSGGSACPSEGAPIGSIDAAADSTALATGGSENASIGFVSTAIAWREIILQKLEAGLTAQRIYQDLHSDHEYAGSYYSVRRLIKKLTATLPAPFRRMECEAGAEAQVDFGRGAPILTPEGKRKGTWVFRIVLSHSRKGYAEVVHRQTTDDFPRVVQAIRAASIRLREFPASGRNETVAGTREIIIPNLPYVVVYRIVADEVQIIRVFQTSMEWQAGMQ
jgi:plasmid stabilization system protein ParE